MTSDRLSLVLMELYLRGLDRLKLRVIGVQFAFDRGVIKALEIERRVAPGRLFRKAFPVFLTDDGHDMALPFIREKELKSHAEYHGDAEQGGERGKQLAAFDLREQSGRKHGVATQFYESHLLPKTQGAKLLADRL